MNRFSFAFSAFAVPFALTMASSQAAHAQSTGLLPVRVKIGALLPTQSTTKTLAGTVVPAAEVDIRIPRFLGGSFATIGYQERGHNGGNLRTVPITISRTFSPANPAGPVTGNVYFGAGAGLYLLDGHDAVGNSKSRATLGGFAQIGYEFPAKYFIEAKYQLTAQRAANLSPNGVLLFVGRSF